MHIPKLFNKYEKQDLHFDILISCIAIWGTFGLYIDGWAHAHNLVDKTFFTPWHAILYSGLFSGGIVLLCAFLINHFDKGYPWKHSLSKIYMISLLGFPILFLAAIGDLIWHTLFGFEVNVQALLSPTHLILATTVIVIFSGPFRSALANKNNINDSSWKTMFSVVSIFLAIYSVFTFFTSFESPITKALFATSNSTDIEQIVIVSSVLLQTFIMMGCILFVIKRFKLPIGSLAIILGINAALLSVIDYQFWLILPAFITGLIGDLLLERVYSQKEQIKYLRIFSFSLPVIYYLLYFSTLNLTRGVTLVIHLWLGVTIMAGAIGILMSYLIAPPDSQKLR